MKLNTIYTVSLLTASLALFSCNDDVENFDNQVYVQASDKTSTVLLKSTVPTAEASFQVAMARPMEHDVTVSLKADPAMAATYNMRYCAEA